MDNIFNLKINIEKGEYAGVLEFALSYCDSFLLVVRNEIALSVSGKMALDALSPFRISDSMESEWPGTRLHGLTARVLRYRFDRESRKVLLHLSENFASWEQPDRPEDLCLIRESREPLLVSTVHEKDVYLVLSDEEIEEFERFILERR